MLTRALARALAPEVRVSASRPGPSRSSQARRRGGRRDGARAGRLARDVAAAIVYLAGADFVTGATLVVDGGRLLQTGRAAPA